MLSYYAAVGINWQINIDAGQKNTVLAEGVPGSLSCTNNQKRPLVGVITLDACLDSLCAPAAYGALITAWQAST